jgi:hypothetical protein
MGKQEASSLLWPLEEKRMHRNFVVHVYGLVVVVAGVPEVPVGGWVFGLSVPSGSCSLVR